MRENNFIRILLLTLTILVLIVGMFFNKLTISSFIVTILALISLFVLDLKATRITQLSADNPKLKTFRLLNFVTVTTFILISIYMISTSSTEITITDSNKYIIIFLAALYIVFFGNLSAKIPFNRYLGLRVPWTVYDEETWNIAHKILSIISLPISILMITMSFILNGEIVFTFGILTWIIIPSLYSLFFYFKKFSTLKL
ncbi:MAG: SdpI family protein [Clostridium sp.]|uniref:SdpI family protein n=1 Tax=Clostridium sp. TaxID=1506 RepID=UPI002FC7BF20